MKRYFASFLMVACLASLSWAQGTKELFDARKCQEELEIMKGILGTTLSFIAQNAQRQAAGTASTRTGTVLSRWGYSGINAFYLYGQGAVFVIPGSSLRGVSSFAYSDGLKALASAQARLVQESDQIAALAAGAGAGMGAGTATAAPPKPSQAPKTPPPPQTQEELSKKLNEQLERAKKTSEDRLANREKLIKAIAEMKGYLLEALANYGDSLTTVKPNEYINVVISADDFDNIFVLNGDVETTHREVISVQKSWITDFKAGRLTLDAFKQRALQYNE